MLRGKKKVLFNEAVLIDRIIVLLIACIIFPVIVVGGCGVNKLGLKLMNCSVKPLTVAFPDPSGP